MVPTEGLVLLMGAALIGEQGQENRSAAPGTDARTNCTSDQDICTWECGVVVRKGSSHVRCNGVSTAVGISRSVDSSSEYSVVPYFPTR